MFKSKPLNRIQKIKDRVARDRRIEGWIRSMRIADDTGLGDTVIRLKRLTKSKEVKSHLRTMLQVQACDTGEAVRRLNEKHRYATHRPPMDGRPIVLDKPAKVTCKPPTSRRAVVVIAPDTRPQAELAITRPLIKQYAERVGADYIELCEPAQLNHGAANKYAVCDIAEHYEQTLLIDTDVIPTPEAPDIFDAVPLGKWGMVDDLPPLLATGPIGQAWIKKEWDSVCAVAGKKELTATWNSGLAILPPDACREYFAPDYAVPNLWCIEQHLLTFKLLGKPDRVLTLDKVWQAGFPWRDFPEAIESAYFIHANGIAGPHSVRLAFLEHFATGKRDIPTKLLKMVQDKEWSPWWARNN